MPSQSYGEAGASSGPMGSVPFGQGQQLEQAQQAGNQGARQQGGSAGGGAAAPPPAAGGAPQQPDAQPQGGEPPFQFDPKNFPLRPGPQLPQTWREQLQHFVNHPGANDSLRRLAILAKRGRPPL